MICIAVGSNGAFGLRGGLPWDVKEELAHFKRLTLHKTLLVGKNTSIPPLPNRTVIRASRGQQAPPDAILIGGKTLIQSLQHTCHTWYISRIDFPFPIEADVFYDPDLTDWVLTEETIGSGWCRKNLCPVTIRYQTYIKK